MRYPHYLRPATGGRWPQRVFAVECTSADNALDKNVRSITEKLSRWLVTELSLAEGQYRVVSYASGGTAAGWWSWLESQLTDTRSTWLLSESCGRVWPLIGLWEAIENGTVRIAGTDPYSGCDVGGNGGQTGRGTNVSLGPQSSSESARARNHLSGMLVVADPPCIATCRIGQSGTRVTWVDACNYSVRLPEHINRGAYALDWLVKFWCNYHYLITGLNLGSAQTTTGSQALHGWRVGYYTGGVYSGGPAEITELEQRASIGGRCECYRIGKVAGPVYHLDIRSAYAYMCTVESVPTRPIRLTNNPTVDALAESNRSNACIASVRVRTMEPSYPYRLGSEVIYPVGEYDTVLAGPELSDALHYSRVIRCNAVVEYESAKILSRYARAVYGLRCHHGQMGNVEMESVCKSLLTALPGKFGQRDRRWTHCPEMWTDIRYGEYWGVDAVGRGCRYRSLAGVVQRDDILGLSAEACPAVAAWILSAARARLLNLITIARWESVLYCDTDAIMVDADGYRRLLIAGRIANKVLGELYIHGVYGSVEIRGVKSYIADGKIVCSGMPRGQCTDAGDGVHYWYDNRASVDAAHHARPSAGRSMHQYSRMGSYRGGIVADDGSVKPHTIG